MAESDPIRLSNSRPEPGADGAGVTVDPPQRARPLHQQAEQIGPYRILEKIGEGGMGLVYKAEQRQPVRRIVALKVIKLGMDTKEVVARFEAERQALAVLAHPNVAKVLDAGMTDTGRPYFAMEFVAGVPLRDYCDQNKLTIRERLELFIPVCHAIQHAHQKGIIHRDLKPSNILVSLFDGKPVPKVIDFGIAKATNHQLAQHTLYTQTGAMIGTPEYMSPEQAMTSGLDVDTRTDIYSLGVILFELLTGTLPFDPEALRKAGLEGMARMIRETEPPKPSTRLTTIRGGDGPDPAVLHRTDARTLQRQIRGDLDWITLKAMEKDRTRRYETANGFAMDLQRYLSDEPVLARPPSTLYRTGKFVRKHKLGVAAIGAVAAALVLGIIGTSVGLVRARQARDLAIRSGEEADRQRKAAELSRDDANAATRFLRDMFIALGSSGADPRQRMDPIIRRLDNGWMAEQPETAIGCRIALGFTFLRSSPDESERQFNAALELAHARHGDVLPELTAPANEGLGYVYQIRRDLPTAEKYLRQSIADFKRFRTPPTDLGYVSMNLAGLLELQAKANEAKQLRLAALDAFINAKGVDIAARPDVAGNYVDRARYLLRAGRFKEALPDLVKAANLNGDEHMAWYYLAALQLQQGDEAGYRASAAEMFRRFGNSSSAEERDRTAKICALSSKPAADNDQLAKMVNYAMASNVPVGKLAWFQVARAMAEYRAGRWQEAMDAIDHTRELTPPAVATGEFILAIIRQRQGQIKAARETFDRAENRVKTQVEVPGITDLGVSPEDYLVMDALRKETEKAFSNAGS
jgi:serine/threonine protein kinase